MKTLLTPTLNAALASLLMTLVSLEVATSWWHLVDIDSVLGLWLYSLPDLVHLHVAPGPEMSVALDTIVYACQSALIVLIVRAARRRLGTVRAVRSPA